MNKKVQGRLMEISPIFLSNRKLIEIFEANIKAKLDEIGDGNAEN